jgi:hypothetical protein
LPSLLSDQETPKQETQQGQSDHTAGNTTCNGSDVGATGSLLRLTTIGPVGRCIGGVVAQARREGRVDDGIIEVESGTTG